MSINTVTMYSAKCDNCQEGFEAAHTGYCAFVDKESCRDAMVNDASNDWLEHEIEVKGRKIKKHYCPECYQFDSEDRLMLNTARKVEPNVYSRDECVFHFCASPELCKEKDACCNG
jgi:hypothetical protein